MNHPYPIQCEGPNPADPLEHHYNTIMGLAFQIRELDLNVPAAWGMLSQILGEMTTITDAVVSDMEDARFKAACRRIDAAISDFKAQAKRRSA